MKYRILGRTRFEVSDIAYGLWGMSGWTGSNDDESLKALQLSVDLGCNFFDTAWAYGEGKSDGLLGEILQRDNFSNPPVYRLYAASKIPPMNDKWPATPEYKYSEVFPAEHVFKYAKLIREKLREDSIDVLQFHVWDDSWTDEPEFRETVRNSKPTNGFAPSASASTVGSPRTASRRSGPAWSTSCRSSTTSSIRRPRMSCSRPARN